MKKKLIPYIIGTIMAMTIALPMTIQIKAESINNIVNITSTIESADTIMDNSIKNGYFTTNEDGNVIYFKTKKDFDTYKNIQNNSKSNEIEPYYGEMNIATVLSTEYKNMLWIGYHSKTPEWTKSSSYTLAQNATYSVSGNYKYKDTTFNIGFSYSDSISRTIPSDATKWSRLGVWGDFVFDYVKYTEYYQGKQTGNISYGYTCRRTNSYIAPAYQ